MREIELYMEAMSWFRKGEDMIGTDKENGDEQAEMFRKAIEVRPEFPQAHYNLGLIYMNRNKMKDAAVEFETVLRIEPDFDTGIYHLLGAAHRDAGNFEEAIAAFENGLRRKPKDAAMRYNIGLIYMRQRKMAEAAEEFDRARVIEPENVDLLQCLGDARAYLNQHILAVDAYQSAINHGGDAKLLLPKLGFSLAGSGRVSAAIEVLEKAVGLDAKNPDSWFLLGDLYSDSGKSEEAINAYRKSLTLRTDQKEIRLNLGVLYAEKEMYAEAMTELRQAVALDSNYALAWSNIALAAEKLEDDKEAIAAHERLIALGGGTAYNHFHLGVLYAKNDQPDPSIDAFAKAIELEPEKYRRILKEELKNVRSALDGIRFQKRFTSLLTPQ